MKDVSIESLEKYIFRNTFLVIYKYLYEHKDSDIRLNINRVSRQTKIGYNQTMGVYRLMINLNLVKPGPKVHNTTCIIFTDKGLEFGNHLYKMLNIMNNKGDNK